MQVGVVFPQVEIGSDPGAIRAYADAVSALGYRHLLAYDHVVGADPLVHAGWKAPYDIHSTFHEPMVLFGYLAGISDLELVTGIIIAPQRQTVLLAKQAAEVDVLTGGRLRLGVGLGWNRLEYEALGKEFSDRSKRLVEQVTLLRQLWSDESVTFDGEYEQLRGVGILPMPIQRPIPIWIGGSAAPALRRIGRLADGWFPLMPLGPVLDEAIGIVTESAQEVGRGPVPFEGRVTLTSDAGDSVGEEVTRWRDLGAQYISLNTMGQGHGGVDGHIAALGRAAPGALLG